VVVLVGETVIDPFAGMLPMPWLIDALVALVDVQINSVASPLNMVAGSALISIAGLLANSGRIIERRIISMKKWILSFFILASLISISVQFACQLNRDLLFLILLDDDVIFIDKLSLINAFRFH
jgi:hypothetical protein